MYDFYFGTKKEIDNDPKKYLLSIKRMLPRWCNSIPDSEYLALYDAIYRFGLPGKPTLVETGSGASTIVLCYFAIKKGGSLFTWDTNGSKLYYLRGVLNDTLMRHFSGRNLNNHWQYIAQNSTSDFAGISILTELNKKVDACFLDSEHTLEVLMREVSHVSNILNAKALVAIDDANYSYRFRNTAYINMIRKKHGLQPIKESKNNIGKHFWEEVSAYLQSNFRKVKYLENSYRKNYQSDIFWSYFKADRDVMASMAMEKTADLDHRFDVWEVRR